ncbi:MAG: o-succinylbenzoate synthase [Candidatus Heimdallarchaeota archaeon]|nr:o-succinylbenzoate synthase [Candidatus Heimdallarchaeota archaeon]
MLNKVILREVRLPLIEPFYMSFGVQTHNESILVELIDEEGLSGWGEIPLTYDPSYCYETTMTGWHILNDFMLPLLKKKVKSRELTDPIKFQQIFHPIRGHPITKGGFGMAYWVLKAEQQNCSLGKLIGSKRTSVPVGISLGIPNNNDINQLFEEVTDSMNAGYKRIKIKIKPYSWDTIPLEALRKEYGDNLPLMVDANGGYTIEDMNHLKKLDQFNLMMIEQPLAFNDLVNHSRLQKELKTPICLDESITSFADTKRAYHIKSCQCINIKVTRVGGIADAVKIAKFCSENQIGCWGGGMLETGIGGMVNLFLEAQDEYNYPSDSSGSDTLFLQDIIDPPIQSINGMVNVPQNSVGLGIELDLERIEKITVKKKEFRFN